MVRVLLFLLCCWAGLSWGQERVTIAYPGPFNTPFLPLDLAQRIGADRAEGLELVPRYVSGGAGLKDLESRNVDFVMPGVPAAMSSKSRGNDVVLIAPINDLPILQLLVRKDLKATVKRPRDLAGRMVGVTSSTLTAKTTSHQVAELLLRQDGVPHDQIRLLAVGQSWEDISAAARGGLVDAIVAFEPFPERLVEAGLMFPLVNLGEPAIAAKVPGAGFLFAGVVTRSDVIVHMPERVGRVVAMVRQTLEWIARHSPEEIVAALKIEDEAKRAALLKSLRTYPRTFSSDGRFSKRQLAETDRFFAAVEGSEPAIRLDGMSDMRWAGVKP